MTRRGITLVEILVSTVICALLFGILAAAAIESSSVFQTADVLAILQADARLALIKMVSDLRETSLSQIAIAKDTPIVNTDTIQYYLPLDANLDGVPDDLTRSSSNFWDLNIITISFDPSTKSLIKNKGTNIDVLANYIKGIYFFDYTLDNTLSMNELKIILELEKATSQGHVYNTNYTAVVSMRN